jgi:2'-phosphotransferase
MGSSFLHACTLSVPCFLAHVQKRFVLDESTDPPRIRAAQGHSVQLEDPVLEAVTSADSVPWAVHVTSQDG